MKEKVYKTSKEQIEILKNRGLTISDEVEAEEILERTNYYNLINGYKSPFLTESYREGSTIEEIISLYKFDRSLSRLYLSTILNIENTLKTTISNIFSSKYGHKNEDYLQPINFNDDKRKSKSVNNLIERLKKYINDDNSKKQYLLHYKYKHNYVPLWVLINYMSLGEIVWFYQILKPKDQIAVAKKLSINTTLMRNHLEIMLNTISDYRNICAHDERFYDYQSKNNNGLRYSVNFNKADYGVNQLYSSVFSLAIIFKVLLTKSDFNDFLESLINILSKLETNLHSIDLKYILNQMDFINNKVSIDSIEAVKSFLEQK